MHILFTNLTTETAAFFCFFIFWGVLIAEHQCLYKFLYIPLCVYFNCYFLIMCVPTNSSLFSVYLFRGFCLFFSFI